MTCFREVFFIVPFYQLVFLVPFFQEYLVCRCPPYLPYFSFSLYFGGHAFSGKKRETNRKWRSVITQMADPTSYRNSSSRLHLLWCPLPSPSFPPVVAAEILSCPFYPTLVQGRAVSGRNSCIERKDLGEGRLVSQRQSLPLHLPHVPPAQPTISQTHCNRGEKGRETLHSSPRAKVGKVIPVIPQIPII